jgi:hypothetical protein
MACSADYMALVRTVSGLTPEDPYSVTSFLGVKFDVPNPGAYSEWRTLSIVISGKMYDHFVALGEVETARVQKGQQVGFPQWNAHVEEVNRIYNAALALPDSLEAIADTKWWSDHISDAEQISIDAACEMERLDYAMLEYKVTPPGLPKIGGAIVPRGSMGFLEKAAWIGGVALVGVGVFYAIRASRRSSSPTPAPLAEAA